MNSDYTIRDRIIAGWFFQDWIGNKSPLPDPEDVFIFMKIVMDVISSHEKLNEQVREYLIGRAAILGASQELLDKLQSYEPNLSKDTNKLYESFNLPHVQQTRMGILYNLFRIFGDDHQIDSDEVEWIYMIGKKLGVNQDQIEDLQNLFEEENKLREKRGKLLFPQGFNAALQEYQKLH